MSNAEMGIIPDHFDLPLGKSVEAEGLDKAMVWDEERKAYRLINDDLATVKKLTRKPADWATWGSRIMVGVGVLATAGCLIFTASYFVKKALAPETTISARVQDVPAIPEPSPETGPLPSQPPPVVSKQAAEPPAAPASTAVEASPKLEAAAKDKELPAVAAKPKVEAAAKPPVAPPPAETRNKPSKREEAPAAAAPKPSPATALVQTPQAKPETAQPQPRTASAPMEAAAVKQPAKPAASPAEPAAARSWAMRVENNGVLFSGNNRLYRVGEILPNGERLVDVDEGSSTYATDRGIRQIRSSSVR